MINLKKKYNYIQKKKFSIGDVLKVNYIVFLKTKKKKKKMYSFIGLCINRKNNYFELVNIVKKEKIYMSFYLNSPVIFKYLIIKVYKKVVFRVSKIYFKNNNYYFDDYKNKDNVIVSNLSSFKLDFFFSAYLKKTLMAKKKKKLRKLRRKYKKTENGKILKKNYYFYKKFLVEDEDENNCELPQEY